MPGERTEQATPKRRQDARGKGQVLKSTEVNTAAILVGGAAFLQWTLPGITRSIMELTRDSFQNIALADMTQTGLQARSLSLLMLMAKLAGPFLAGLVAVAVVANISQVGFLLSGHSMQPQFSRINPLSGLQRLFSSRTLVELLKTVAKVSLIGFFAWQAVQDKGPALVQLSTMEPQAAASTVTGMIMGLIWKVAGAFIALALLDYTYQRWWFDRNLRMSRQDIKDEMRQSEGDPMIRSRLRQRARALARQRMMAQVAKSDVVVTNPTHFAVALKYESGAAAPVVVAKGERLIAQQIKKLAREHNVPTVENKPLAQALFKSCEVGQAVPPELYKAVAEVLAFVYRLRPDRAPTGYGMMAAQA